MLCLECYSLVVVDELFFEQAVVDLLHWGILVDGVNGSGGSTLAQDHENRFHANGAKGDVGTRNANRH